MTLSAKILRSVMCERPRNVVHILIIVAGLIGSIFDILWNHTVWYKYVWSFIIFYDFIRHISRNWILVFYELFYPCYHLISKSRYEKCCHKSESTKRILWLIKLSNKRQQSPIQRNVQWYFLWSKFRENICTSMWST